METRKKKKILLVLPRGEAIRNFILSGTADELRKEAELIVLSVVPNDKFRKLVEANADVFYELKDVPQAAPLRYLRQWIDIVHGRWLWSGAAKLRWKLRDSEAVSLSRKIKRSINKAAAYPFIHRPGVEFLTKVEGFLSQKVYKSDAYLKLLKDLKPDHVFNGSHIHSKVALPVMHAARSLGIPTSTFLFSWDNLTSQGRIMPKYSKYMVWNEDIRHDLLRIYPFIGQIDTAVTGTPQFDFHFRKDKIWSREEYCRRMGIDPSRPIILYTTGMLNLMPKEEVIVENIANMLQAYPADRRPQLIVRVYPKDLSGRFEEMKARRKDVAFPDIPWEQQYLTPMPEDLELWSNMLYHCEAGINVASTVSLELCMFDKPVINVAYNPPGQDITPKDYPIYYTWDHYKPIVDTNALHLAHNEEDMRNLIAHSLAHPEDKRQERKFLIDKFFGNTLDGFAYKRVAERLLEWTGKN